jgi:hypothetical protein
MQWASTIKEVEVSLSPLTLATDADPLAIAFLQRVACHVEAILGYLDRLLDHHCWLLGHGFSHRAIRLQDVSSHFSEFSARADETVPTSLASCRS